MVKYGSRFYSCVAMVQPQIFFFVPHKRRLRSGEWNNGNDLNWVLNVITDALQATRTEKKERENIMERCFTVTTTVTKMMLIVLAPVYSEATIKPYDLISRFHQQKGTKRRFAWLNALIYFSVFILRKISNI